MATENQRVVAYLSHDEMAELKALSVSWGLSLSKTIARLVREVGTPKPDNVPTMLPPSGSVTDEMVVALIDAKVGTLRNELEGRLGKLVAQAEGHGLAIANLQGKLIGLEGDVKGLKRPPEPSQTKGEAISSEQKTEPLQAEIEAPIFVDNPDTVTGGELPGPDGWSAEQLAARLGVSKPWIQLYRTEPDFPDRTSKKDPDGLAWESRPPEGKKRVALFPIIGDRQLAKDPQTLTE